MLLQDDIPVFGIDHLKDAQKTNGGSWTKNQRSRETRDLQSAEIQPLSAILNLYRPNIERVVP